MAKRIYPLRIEPWSAVRIDTHGEACAKAMALRGKRFPIGEVAHLFAHGMAIPHSIYLMDAHGEMTNPFGRGVSDGDQGVVGVQETPLKRESPHVPVTAREGITLLDMNLAPYRHGKSNQTRRESLGPRVTLATGVAAPAGGP